MQASPQPTLPKSVAHWSDPFTIGAVIFGLYWAMRSTTLNNLEITEYMVIGLTLFTCFLELLRAPWRKTPRPDVPFKDVLVSASIKWVGTMTGFCLMLIFWWALQEYQRTQYGPMFRTLPQAIPYVPGIVFATHLFTEWRLGPSGGDGKDLGLFTLLRWKEVDYKGVREELLCWFIKAFFLIINYSELPKTLKIFRNKEDTIFALPWVQLQPVIVAMIYAFIIASILPGYLFSAKIFGTHIRRVADSWFAYAVTLVCYSPYANGLVNRWFNYHPVVPEPEWMKPWVSQFNGNDTMLYIIGGTILLFEFVHYWGESIMGIRSSNLTNRGIVTSGPYRYCKHPVFASKCASWLIMWMPFVSGDTVLECIRLMIAWCGISFVFAARCWAEERILAEDKDYVAYALWVDKNGVFAPISRFIPLLQFRWRLKRWIRRGEIDARMLPE